LSRAKHLGVWASLKYGWRLTFKHMNTLVPGTIVFYLPELAGRLGVDMAGWGWAKTAFKTAVGCWLLWHALQLSDAETRHSRLHEPTLPAKGFLGRFLASTLLFWGGLGLGLWPSLFLLTGTWHPSDYVKLSPGWQPSPWPYFSWRLLLVAGVAAVPVGLWTVYGWFHGYYVADEGQDAWPSMVASYHSVKGAFWRTTGFLAVVAAVNAAGLALWFVGIFVAFPITLMATTYVHLELKKQTGRHS